MTAVDDFTQADLGLVSEGGAVAGLFIQDTTSITKGAALVMEGTTDFKVQIADTAKALNFVGIAETPSKNTTPVAGDEIPVVTMGPLCKVKIDGGSNDVAPGDLLVLDDDGSLIKLVAFDAPGSYGESTIQTELDKIYSVVAMALQNHDEDGDSGVVLMLR